VLVEHVGDAVVSGSLETRIERELLESGRRALAIPRVDDRIFEFRCRALRDGAGPCGTPVDLDVIDARTRSRSAASAPMSVFCAYSDGAATRSAMATTRDGLPLDDVPDHFSMQGLPEISVRARREPRQLYARPTRPAHVWEDDPRVIGGRRYARAGAGSRCGAAASSPLLRMCGVGRAGANRTRTPVADFVRDVAPTNCARSIRGDDFAGFHLIVGDGDVVHVSNTGETQPVEGIFAISNGPPGSDWPKVDLARDFLSAALERHRDADALDEDLLRFLSTQRRTAIESEVFVTSEKYGTRSSTVIVGDLFVEQNFGPRGVCDGAARRFRSP
jgi:uncharacterized protein with NRDE domain